MATKHDRSALFGETYDAPDAPAPKAIDRVPWLTILHHPSPGRAGEEIALEDLASRRELALSRTEPDFTSPEGSEPWPVGDPFVSRKPILLRQRGDAIELEPSEANLPVTLDGAPLSELRRIPLAELDRGVLLELSGRVILLLHRRTRRGARGASLGLVGHSEAMESIRASILRVAELGFPVLLLGATGTGKELIARALHEASPRRERPFEAVNLGAFAPQMAAAELFGHVKGAFTGAVADNPGYFARADGGTLFLDEIGEAPSDVQVMLLRVLETAMLQAVGAQSARRVDVRVVAATDADLEGLIAENKFRAALLHRLRGFEIRIAPLAARREDLGRLIQHFVREVLRELDETHRLDPAEAVPRPWFPASVARPLLNYGWPGNVRELRNTIRQLLIANRGAAELALDPSTEHQLRALASRAPPESESESAPPSKRKPAEIGEDEVLAALGKHRWKIGPTAKYLGISSSSLHMLIDRCPNIRKAGDLTREEILAAREDAGTELDALAAHLRVSSRGLLLRLKALGLDR